MTPSQMGQHEFDSFSTGNLCGFNGVIVLLVLGTSVDQLIDLRLSSSTGSGTSFWLFKFAEDSVDTDCDDGAAGAVRGLCASEPVTDSAQEKA